MNAPLPSDPTPRGGPFGRRQPVLHTLRDIATRAWIRVMVRLAPLSDRFIGWAGLPLGPYKEKRQLLRYLGERAYVSPKADVHCPRLTLGPRCFIDDGVTLYAHPRAMGSVRLGRGVHLYRWTMVELGDGGSVEIGENVALQSGCVLNAFVASIRIGANSMIGPRCVFMPYQHGFADRERPMREQPLTSKGDIVLEDDVWLGANVVVLEGVTIGRGAIVGAGAVVTRDIPPYAIAAGVPARVLRQRGKTEAEDETQR